MICKNCSTEFEGKFCPECGTPSEQEEQNNYSAQPVEEAEVAVDSIEPDNGEYVTETVTPPTAVDEGDYYIPPIEQVEEPKKGKKKTGIIIAVIVIILAAVFCVVSFTDLVFSKKAQFSSVMSNVFGGMELDSAAAESTSAEMKLSVKLNSDSDFVNSEIPEEYVEVLNSLGVTIKANTSEDEIKEIIYIYEDDKEITSLEGEVDDGAVYVKFDFSDVVFMAPYAMLSDLDESKALSDMIIEQVKAVFESEEPEKGKYNGKFDLDAEVNVLTVTLDEDEIDEFAKNVSEKTYEIMGLDGSEYVPGSSEIKELRISTLYSGMFSFARKALGIAVEVEFNDGEKCEIVYFSNGENKAVYGIVYEEDGESMSIVANDTFTVNGSEQSGTVKIKASGDGADEINEIFDKLSITYTKSEEKLDAQISYFEGADEIKVNISLTGSNTTFDASIKASLNSEEIGTVNIGATVCDPFEVDIDKSEAVNINNTEDLSSEDKLKYATLISDLTNWMVDNNDSKLVALVESLYISGGESGSQGNNELGGDTLEEVLSIRDISFTPMQFDTDESETYYIVDDMVGYIDIQEFGYNGDIVSEARDTIYYEASSLSYSEKREYVESMETYYEEYDEESDNVAMEFKISGDYVVMRIVMTNLDDPDTYKTLVSDGFVYIEEAGERAYLDEIVESLLSLGYQKA